MEKYLLRGMVQRLPRLNQDVSRQVQRCRNDKYLNISISPLMTKLLVVVYTKPPVFNPFFFHNADYESMNHNHIATPKVDINEITKLTSNKTKCKYFNCSCPQYRYIEGTSKWNAAQCADCNHPASKHEIIRSDFRPHQISRQGSIRRAYEILWRYLGHSYTLSTSSSTFTINDLRKHVSTKLMLNQSLLNFKLDGQIVSDFNMDIIPYFEQQNVRTITFDVILKDKGPRIVRTGRWTPEFLAEFERNCRAKKLYYMTFPSLVDYAQQMFDSNKMGNNSVNSAMKKLTNEVIQEKPSGNPQHRDTLLHVLNGMAAQKGKKCFFYDSSKNIKPESKSDETSYLNAADHGDKFVLSLDSITSVLDIDDEKCDANTILVELQSAVMGNKEHPVVEKIRSKLATVHGVDVIRITIQDIYAGSFNVVYTVEDLSEQEKRWLIKKAAKMEQKMKKMFGEYKGLAIHPALFHNSYDVSMFDARGNKTFTEAQVFQVGPRGAKKPYTQPKGWTRYGLKVLGKYLDDKWLCPFGDDANWYRSFHGTGREAGSSIYKGAFRISNNDNGTRAKYGPGVYNSPDIREAAMYSSPIKIETQTVAKYFLYVLMVAVNPRTLNRTRVADAPDCYWIAPTPADIRPYGILLKEIPVAKMEQYWADLV